MASDIKEAIRRMIYQYVVEGADKVMATQEAVAASTTTTDKASLSLEKTFGSLERRYVETVRHQQDYQKVQEKVNAAVAQNPALQERANVVLAQARQHFDNIAIGADKGSMAATALARTLSRTIGPLALIAAAVAGLRSAFEFFAPIAIRAGTQLYDSFAKAFPAVSSFAEGIAKVVSESVQLEYTRQKSEAVAAALNGVASSAQLAALALKSANQNKIDQRSMAEAAQAAERMADAMVKLSEKYKGMTLDTAKQLELLEAQLTVARARTQEETLMAEQKKRVLELTLLQGKSEEEALEIAIKERQIAEELLKKKQELQTAANDYNRSIDRLDDEQARVTDEVDNTTDAVNRGNDATKRWVQTTTYLGGAFEELGSIASEIDNRLSALNTQFAGTRVEISNDAVFAANKLALEKQFGAGNVEVVTVGGGFQTYRAAQVKPEALFGQTKSLQDRPEIQDLIKSQEQLAKSTDSLNATMQNALSPYYSQDPRTTKLGFRAGVTGNPDWLAPGASNANPLAAILGPGATAPGMASGGSFIVGGGYSANDNKIAAFPVASGEQVVVNRNPGGGAQVVNIDNRIIVTGAVDDDALSKLKVSRYQQTQRMRAGLARA